MNLLILRNFIKILCIPFLFSIGTKTIFAEDLFEDNFSREFKSNTMLTESTTIGGYPIYIGGRSWRILSGGAKRNNINQMIGYASLVSPMNNKFFAQMNLTVNLDQGNGYFLGEPCKLDHLVKIDNGGGVNDNCLAIDAKSDFVNGKAITTLRINIRNSQSAGRLYDMEIFLNLDQLGYPYSNASEWTKEIILDNNQKHLLIKKVTSWASELHGSVDKAISFKKPKDAFEGVSSINDLLTSNNLDLSESITPTESSIIKNTTNSNLPSPDTPPIEWKSLEKRLSDLKSLLDRGLISNDLYEKKSSEIIRDF